VRPVIAFVGCRVAVTIGFNGDEGWLVDVLGIPDGWLDCCEVGDVGVGLEGWLVGWLVGCLLGRLVGCRVG